MNYTIMYDNSKGIGEKRFYLTDGEGHCSNNVTHTQMKLIEKIMSEMGHTFTDRTV